jgi:hypothetical protein
MCGGRGKGGEERVHPLQYICKSMQYFKNGILGMSNRPYILIINCRCTIVLIVRYHSGGSMKLNACNLLLAHMVYL